MALNEKQMERLSKFSKERLLDFIDMVQRNWWNLQNNYILYINNEYGEEAAVKADGYCFPANARVQVYRLKKLLNLENDLDALMEAMILSTIWVNCDYEISKVGKEAFRIRVTNCYQQVRRVEEGIGELGCKSAGIVICREAARVINPKAEVKCLSCPPDKHLDNLWCEWEFYVP